MTTIELNLFSQKYPPPNELIIIECAGHSQAYAYTVVSHIYTYDRAQNILNFVQPLQNLIL